MNKKGFTLTELLIVVAIIGILAMIAIPTYTGQQLRAARTEAYTNLQNLRMLQEQYFAENGEYAPNTPTGTGNSDPASNTLRYGVFGGITYDSSNTITSRNIYFFLPGFKPGLAVDLKYDYEITFSYTSDRTTTFIATATGKAGSVIGDSFTINELNVKSGGW